MVWRGVDPARPQHTAAHRQRGACTPPPCSAPPQRAQHDHSMHIAQPQHDHSAAWPQRTMTLMAWITPLGTALALPSGALPKHVTMSSHTWTEKKERETTLLGKGASRACTPCSNQLKVPAAGYQGPFAHLVAKCRIAHDGDRQIKCCGGGQRGGHCAPHVPHRPGRDGRARGQGLLLSGSGQRSGDGGTAAAGGGHARASLPRPPTHPLTSLLMVSASSMRIMENE